MENDKETEYLLQISVMAVDLRDACSKVAGGTIVSGGPMPKAPMIAKAPPPPPPAPPLLPPQNPSK